MAKLTSWTLILIAALCSIQSGHAIKPFTAGTFIIAGSDGFTEMTIDGNPVQTFNLPQGYNCPACIIHLDSTGAQLILPLSTGSAGNYNLFAYTINSNGDFVDQTSVTSTSPIRDAIIKGQDVWINYFDGVAHVTRGSLGSSSATDANILTNVDPQIKSIQYDSVKDQLGYIYGGGSLALTTASTGPYSLSPFASTTAAWLDYPYYYRREISTINNVNYYLLSCYYFNNAINGYTKLFSGDASVDIVFMTGIKLYSLTYIIYVSPAGNVYYMMAQGTKFNNPVLLQGAGTAYSVVASPKVTCTDNLKNQDETDIDCGGATCAARCIAEKVCTVNGDCVSNVCDNGLCVATCNDGLKNQDEADVDCGGSLCTACEDGKMCTQASDCSSSYCSPNNNCTTPSCDDGFQNFGESDVDCGGNNCAPCSLGDKCTQNSDCSTSTCAANVCVNAPVASPDNGPSTAPADNAPNAGPNSVQTPQSNNSPGNSSPNSAPTSSTPSSVKVSSGIAMECSLVVGLIIGTVALII